MHWYPTPANSLIWCGRSTLKRKMLLDVMVFWPAQGGQCKHVKQKGQHCISHSSKEEIPRSSELPLEHQCQCCQCCPVSLQCNPTSEISLYIFNILIKGEGTTAPCLLICFIGFWKQTSRWTQLRPCTCQGARRVAFKKEWSRGGFSSPLAEKKPCVVFI